MRGTSSSTGAAPAPVPVILATTVTHGLSELFAEPDRFDPTRFSPERAEHRTPGAYVPFGVGTHTCAGRGLAEGLLTLNTALLLHRLRFTGDPAYTLGQVARPTPSPDNRLRINVLGSIGSVGVHTSDADHSVRPRSR